MARYEHLPIYRAAFDLAVHMEKIVRHFSRYHKYTLGTELRNNSRMILDRVIEANNTVDRQSVLLRLRQELESPKVLARLCHESGGDPPFGHHPLFTPPVRLPSLPSWRVSGLALMASQSGQVANQKSLGVCCRRTVLLLLSRLPEWQQSYA